MADTDESPDQFLVVWVQARDIMSRGFSVQEALVMAVLANSKLALAQVDILTRVSGGGPLSGSDGVNPGTVSKIITRLERGGYLRRTKGRNARTKSVSLTARGRDVVLKTPSNYCRQFRRLIAAKSDEAGRPSSAKKNDDTPE